jgi:ABC-type glycerol-3-phosphate transport system substrate-binding protein
MDFLRYLLRPEVQASFCKSTGLLPVRHENWSRPPYLTEDQYRIMYQALLNGRAFYSAPLWGMIEEKLMSTLHRAWSDVLSQKSPDVPQIVGGYLDNLEVTLNLAIAG